MTFSQSAPHTALRAVRVMMPGGGTSRASPTTALPPSSFDTELSRRITVAWPEPVRWTVLRPSSHTTAHPESTRKATPIGVVEKPRHCQIPTPFLALPAPHSLKGQQAHVRIRAPAILCLASARPRSCLAATRQRTMRAEPGGCRPRLASTPTRFEALIACLRVAIRRQPRKYSRLHAAVPQATCRDAWPLIRCHFGVGFLPWREVPLQDKNDHASSLGRKDPRGDHLEGLTT